MNNQNLNPELFKFRVPRRVRIDKGRYDFILEKCRGKKVLHLGCVDEGLLERRLAVNALLHVELEKVAKEVWGVDISKEGIGILKEYSRGKLLVGNVEHLDTVQELKDQHFDVILATELIEHLDNVGLFLDSAKHFFSSETIMIITTPNAFRLNGIVYNLFGYEYVHPDHNYWFSWRTLSTLLQKHGYKICEEALYSYGVFNWVTLRKESQKLLGELTGGKFKTSKEDDLSKTPLRIVIDIMGFPLRMLLYKLNPFFGEGLMFVVKI